MRLIVIRPPPRRTLTLTSNTRHALSTVTASARTHEERTNRVTHRRQIRLTVTGSSRHNVRKRLSGQRGTQPRATTLLQQGRHERNRNLLELVTIQAQRRLLAMTLPMVHHARHVTEKQCAKRARRLLIRTRRHSKQNHARRSVISGIARNVHHVIVIRVSAQMWTERTHRQGAHLTGNSARLSRQISAPRQLTIHASASLIRIRALRRIHELTERVNVARVLHSLHHAALPPDERNVLRVHRVKQRKQSVQELLHVTTVLVGLLSPHAQVQYGARALHAARRQRVIRTHAIRQRNVVLVQPALAHVVELVTVFLTHGGNVSGQSLIALQVHVGDMLHAARRHFRVQHAFQRRGFTSARAARHHHAKVSLSRGARHNLIRLRQRIIAQRLLNTQRDATVLSGHASLQRLHAGATVHRLPRGAPVRKTTLPVPRAFQLADVRTHTQLVVQHGVGHHASPHTHQSAHQHIQPQQAPPELATIVSEPRTLQTHNDTTQTKQQHHGQERGNHDGDRPLLTQPPHHHEMKTNRRNSRREKQQTRDRDLTSTRQERALNRLILILNTVMRANIALAIAHVTSTPSHERHTRAQQTATNQQGNIPTKTRAVRRLA